jgi:YbbR domain-containing protein
MWKKITESKSFYIAISLIAAFVLWLYVSNAANPDTTGTVRGIRLTISGLERLEERGLMISEGTDQQVTLSLQGKRDALLRVNNSNITVTVDVSNITEPGTVSLDYRISYPLSALGETITERDKRPDRIELTISRQTEKAVEVRLDFTGSVGEDYQLGEHSVAPQTITVRGREEVINQISHAQVNVSVQGMTETYSQETPFTLIGFNGEPLSAELAAEVETEETTILTTLPVVKLKEVPLTVELIPGGGATGDDAQVQIEPESIMVSGDPDDLEGLKEIKLDPIELYNVYNKTNTLTRTINLSPVLTNVSGLTEAEVTVTIPDLVIRAIEVNNIEIINVPEPYIAEKVTLTSTIQIRGTQEAVDAILPSQLRIVADLKDINVILGGQTVPVKVYLASSDDVGVVGNYNISITVAMAG